MGIGYLVMSSIPSIRDSLGGSGALMVGLAVIMTMACSFFVQAGEGSTFAIVPLVKRRITGQIAGNVGAYGNVGAVAYLTLYSLLPGLLGGGADPTPAVIDQSNVIFFQVLGVAALIVAFLCFFILEEPQGSFAEFHEGEKEVVAAHGHPSVLPEDQSARLF
jgi:NNP family nitrate/nitrite transporter-like MFS transporter